jgi:hypothetical protein
MKCPGQDTQNWKPGDIFEALCSNCGRTIEFFKDDTSRRCKGCGARVPNPKLDFGCAAYCEFADQCLAGISSETRKLDGDSGTDKNTRGEKGAAESNEESGT